MSKPVAWGVQSDNDWTEMFWDEKELDELEDFYGQQGWNYKVVPLYTLKQLSDEEIYELWIDAKQTALNTKGGIVELCFARAIIKEMNK